MNLDDDGEPAPARDRRLGQHEQGVRVHDVGARRHEPPLERPQVAGRSPQPAHDPRARPPAAGAERDRLVGVPLLEHALALAEQRPAAREPAAAPPPEGVQLAHGAQDGDSCSEHLGFVEEHGKSPLRVARHGTHREAALQFGTLRCVAGPHGRQRAWRMGEGPRLDAR